MEVQTIQLGDAIDTTLSRFQSGILAVEGKQVPVMDAAAGSGRIPFYTGANTMSAGSSDFTFESVKGQLTVERLNVGLSAGANATDGLIRAENDVIAYATSDKRLKENIVNIPNSLDKIEKINGVTFDWKPLTEEEINTIHSNEGHDVGVIAQEIEAILPELVETRPNGYKAVKYEKIVPLLIEAIKELKHKVEALESK